jgi:hypothetical protein
MEKKVIYNLEKSTNGFQFNSETSNMTITKASFIVSEYANDPIKETNELLNYFKDQVDVSIEQLENYIGFKLNDDVSKNGWIIKGRSHNENSKTKIRGTSKKNRRYFSSIDY